MRKLVIAMLVLGTIVLTAAAALACGDKLVLISAFARLRQLNPGAYSASILAYTPQNSVVPAVIRDLESQRATKQYGHKFKAVEDVSQLDQALKTGKYDVVLT